MKRNNIFMWAYITFMVLSCIVRYNTDFSMWYPIVMAVTVSSMFFAVEDLFSSISGMYERLNEIREHGISNIKGKHQQDTAIDKRIMRMFEENKDDVPVLKECILRFEKLESHDSEIEESIMAIEEGIAKSKIIHKVCNVAAIVSAYLGFLILFTTIILVSFVYISTKLQEMVTVVSFAIILATKQISGITAEYVKKEEEVTVNVINGYEKLIHTSQEIETEVCEMIALEKSKKTNELQEAYAYAD